MWRHIAIIFHQPPSWDERLHFHCLHLWQKSRFYELLFLDKYLCVIYQNNHNEFAIIWYTAWAWVSHRGMSFAVPPCLLCLFLFRNVIVTGLRLGSNRSFLFSNTSDARNHEGVWLQPYQNPRGPGAEMFPRPRDTRDKWTLRQDFRWRLFLWW